MANPEPSSDNRPPEPARGGNRGYGSYGQYGQGYGAYGAGYGSYGGAPRGGATRHALCVATDTGCCASLWSLARFIFLCECRADPCIV